MKRTAALLVLMNLGFFSAVQLGAQCVPDTVNCKDIGNPGQFCPMQLPHAGLDVLYDETVTVIAPGNAPAPYETWIIHYIEIDSVKNLPPGIDYFPNAEIFYPDTAYCIQLTGTPTQIGEFNLAIYIGATVDIYGTPTRVPFVDDSSIVIKVVEVLGVNPNQTSDFHELSIYNILGVLVYQESEFLAPGNHHFSFDGKKLQPGTYLYKVKTNKGYYTGKLLKSR